MISSVIFFLISLSYVHLEIQREFNVSESVPRGHVIGYVNNSATIGVQPNYYIIFPDGIADVDKVSMKFIIFSYSRIK
ncbi:unnamed protein product [Dracunculus medinensis]|uniref:COesterase domain-containing protein n=1 Tax=Dracunculus medinensis TaxID=318479 RepID=A0A0N4U202_DRAME|nr:unnamed protein product [Dracunculus medinensis]